MNFFEPDENSYSEPSITAASVVRAQHSIGGYRLPDAYLDLLREKNGGRPLRAQFNTDFQTDSGENSIIVRNVLGVGGGTYAIDNVDFSNAEFLAEWGIPAIGIAFCETHDHGHEAVMLDYRLSGNQGEPAVTYIGEDRQPHIIAANLTEFIGALVQSDYEL